jgi:hypothetical protein
MSFLIDTIQLVGSLSNVRETLVAALRAKGFPIKEDASLCEIVDTINSGAVDYCGFVRCWVGGDSLYFPDDIEVTLETQRTYAIYETLIVLDKAKLLRQIQRFPQGKSTIIVQDYTRSRKRIKRYFEDLDILGFYTDMCTTSLVHRVTDHKVYIRSVKEQGIIVRDTAAWKLFDANETLINSGN